MKKKNRKNDICSQNRIMFDDNFIVSSCTSKNKYNSIWEAHVVAEECKEKYGKTLHGYHCSICDGYHLTERYGDNCEF